MKYLYLIILIFSFAWFPTNVLAGQSKQTVNAAKKATEDVYNKIDKANKKAKSLKDNLGHFKNHLKSNVNDKDYKKIKDGIEAINSGLEKLKSDNTSWCSGEDCVSLVSNLHTKFNKLSGELPSEASKTPSQNLPVSDLERASREKSAREDAERAAKEKEKKRKNDSIAAAAKNVPAGSVTPSPSTLTIVTTELSLIDNEIKTIEKDTKLDKKEKEKRIEEKKKRKKQVEDHKQIVTAKGSDVEEKLFEDIEKIDASAGKNVKKIVLALANKLKMVAESPETRKLNQETLDLTGEKTIPEGFPMHILIIVGLLCALLGVAVMLAYYHFFYKKTQFSNKEKQQDELNRLLTQETSISTQIKTTYISDFIKKLDSSRDKDSLDTLVKILPAKPPMEKIVALTTENVTQFLDDAPTNCSLEDKRILSTSAERFIAATTTLVTTTVTKRKNTHLSSPSNKYFLGEVLVAAGPRKEVEGELGEDIAGMLVKDQYIAFWVLDGMSNQSRIYNPVAKREVYSSRMLAMRLAEQFQLICRKEILDGNQIGSYLRDALKKTVDIIGDEIAQEPLQSLLRQAEKDGQDLQIATTATFGLLNSSGQLYVCKIGDDSFITENGKTPPKHRASIFCNAVETNGQYIVQLTDISSNKYEVYLENNVWTVMASSDGLVDAAYQEMINYNRKSRFTDDQIQQFKHYHHQNPDDKALCLIQIIEPSTPKK
jgi:hypothetical protein